MKHSKNALISNEHLGQASDALISHLSKSKRNDEQAKGVKKQNQRTADEFYTKELIKNYPSQYESKLSIQEISGRVSLYQDETSKLMGKDNEM